MSNISGFHSKDSICFCTEELSASIYNGLSKKGGIVLIEGCHRIFDNSSNTLSFTVAVVAAAYCG